MTGKHADGDDSRVEVANCGNYDYVLSTDSDDVGKEFVYEDFGAVTDAFSEETCVQVQWSHWLDDDWNDYCGYNFFLLAYSGAYNPNNANTRNVGFLGYGDYYHSTTFSVKVPKGKELHLVAESYWHDEDDDAGDPCYIEVVLSEGRC